MFEFRKNVFVRGGEGLYERVTLSDKFARAVAAVRKAASMEIDEDDRDLFKRGFGTLDGTGSDLPHSCGLR